MRNTHYSNGAMAALAKRIAEGISEALQNPSDLAEGNDGAN
jgi:hypothetical protein